MIKEFAQGCMLFLSMMSVAVFAEADEVNAQLQAHFEKSSDIAFIGYETVEPAEPLSTSLRYLVMDFDSNETALASLQHNIHSICTKVLGDLALVRTLSDRGYDMISVSFDRHSQYDCL